MVSRMVAPHAATVPAVGTAKNGGSVPGAAGSFLVLLPQRVASAAAKSLAARD